MKYLLLILLFVSCSKEPIENNYQTVSTDFYGSDLIVYNRINELRLNNGANILKPEKNVSIGCYGHAYYMFSNNNLSHDNFWQRAVNSKAKYFGEVVAYGYVNPESFISAYTSSADHLSILIDKKYTHIGIANYGLYQCIDLAGY